MVGDLLLKMAKAREGVVVDPLMIARREQMCV